MPANFPEVWENRVIQQLTSGQDAPWLQGIAELNTQVIELGSGTTSVTNLIHLPISDFDPEVLINNTTYPIEYQEYEDDSVVIQLDKYQTKVTTLPDDQTEGASYNIIDSATGEHVKSITRSKYGKAIHSFAPSANALNTPVLQATGADTGTRKRLRYEDLVAAKAALDGLDCPAENRRIVLSSDHYNDLLLDRNLDAKELRSMATGTVVPVIAGFEIFSYINNPYFTSAGVKKAYGVVPGAGDRRASVFFYMDNMRKKTGNTKQYFLKATDNPTRQSNDLNYRHHFIALPVRQKYFGAIY